MRLDVLAEYQSVERDRIETLQQRELRDENAESLILRSAERGIIGWRIDSEGADRMA